MDNNNIKICLDDITPKDGIINDVCEKCEQNFECCICEIPDEEDNEIWYG